MAITTNIPPQAYTRDTLVKAIEWMNSQPASLRERAGSADLIVSYYLQARRRMTAAQMEAPVSGESFKADLKHLAQDLKQFEEPSAPPTQPNRAFAQLQEEPIPQMNFQDPFNPPRVVQPPAAHPQATTQTLPPPHQQPLPTPSAPAASQAHLPKVMTWTIDPRSLAAAREVMQKMNLSHETEALRMLVTLGLERMREVLGPR
jgi:hypothetical protein